MGNRYLDWARELKRIVREFRELVLNDHRKYLTLSDNTIFNNGRNKFKILDAWNVCTELHYCSEINIYTLGNMFI